MCPANPKVHVPHPAPPVEFDDEREATPRVLLIAWSGAEWDVIAPLLESGDCRIAKRLIDRGVMGNGDAALGVGAADLDFSVATGRPPEDMALGYKEPPPDGNATSSFLSSRRATGETATLSDILSEHGFKTHAIGWPASHPAERVNGLTISEIFNDQSANCGRPGRRPPSVAPADQATPSPNSGTIRGDHTPWSATFVPEIDSVDPRREVAGRVAARPGDRARRSRQALTTYVMENEPWDFFALYQPALERISREFLQFHPPQLVGFGEREFERFQGVVREWSRFHNLPCSGACSNSGDEARFRLCSTCGFHTGALRAPVNSWGSAASQPAPFRGLVRAARAACARTQLIFGSRLYDIVPTVLTLF